MPTLRLVLTAILALVLAGTLAGPAPAPAAADDLTAYNVEIRRTAHGIPHITAGDYGSLGYGYGYAFASDNICVAADSYVTVNGQRSRYFGPDATWTFQGNGLTFNNLDSDFFFAQVNDAGIVEDLVSQPPPNGPVEGAKEGVRGYVAGYNRYLREVGGPDGISDPACAGAEWVREITELDAYRRFYQLALLASSGLAFDGIGGAQPPTPPLTGGGDDEAAAADALARLVSGEVDLTAILGSTGSNAWGVGSDGTRNGRGLLVGNPHFPWQGSERFYQAHLTIPGVLDVSGASLFGVPLILIGHTEHMAWSHTVSTSMRLTGYELQLVPGSPTTYLVDGQPREMSRRTVAVDVLEDGEVTQRERTLYTTSYGPVFTSLVGLPLFPWTPERAYALADANAANFRYINHFFAKNQAQTVREVHEINRRYQGIPWVNTIAADSTGEAYYADIGTVPHVTDALVSQCNITVQGQVLWGLARLPVLDGRRSSCAWGHDDDAVQPGTFGPSNQPHLFRRDFVNNANDSHWLSHPEERLEGFNLIIGPERTQRSLRTRLAILMAQDRIAGTDGLGAPGFDADTAATLQLNNRVHAAEVVGDALVAMCREQAPADPGVRDEACDVLEDWDRRADLDSRGTHLFRGFWNRATGSPAVWSDSFDPEEPVTTPNQLNANDPQVRQALRDAIAQFDNADIPLDAEFGDLQWEMRGDERIPIHGSTHGEGAFNVITPVAFSASEQGWPDIRHGSSFIQVVHFTDGCPDVRTFVTYSQSTDPTSDWFADQTHAYSAKQWVRPPFCRADVEEQTIETVVLAEDLPVRVERIAGASRVETAALVSSATFDAAETVLIARADAYPDALAGAPLAAALDAPLLLTQRSGLHPAAEAEIRRLGASRALLLGGTAALSPQVEADLAGAGVAVVERVGGPNRFATAALIAARLPDPGGLALVAEGEHADAHRGWPDALAAAPYAAVRGAPVLLVNADRLPNETRTALANLGITETIVVGGTGAVGDAVVAELAAHNPRRLAGRTRFETAAVVRAEALEQGADAGELWLATGSAFPDALAAGPAVARRNATLLLVHGRDLENSPPTRAALTASAEALRLVRLLGGHGVISAAAEQQVRAALQ